MIVQNSYVYIQIGLCVRLLRNVSTLQKASVAASTLETLSKNLQKGGFDVTLASMTSLAFKEMKKQLAEADKDTALSSPLVAEISSEAVALESVVFAEALTKSIYVLPNRRFNTEYLLTSPQKLLKEGAFQKLDPIARADFASSCRCILFGEATAAAFHILRATESVLTSYYYLHRKQKRLEKPMWANMLDQLRAKNRHKPPESLLTSLDLIRTAYRNPTQHPQITYEIDSAQDLFGVCLDVIGKMTDELSSVV